jgi:branched-chain amino acid transport system ATP-binding protein
LAETKETLLRVEDISAGYGRIEALHGVSLSVMRGEIVSLIGANGSGKSTLLKAVMGLLPISRGTIFFNCCDISRQSVESRVAHGIALVPEGRGVLAPMTVAENLALGAYHRRDDPDSDLNAVFVRFPILKEKIKQTAGNLSGGQQQMLAVGRAIMASPQLLLMDEPSLGLSPIVTSELFEAFVQMKKEGFTILLAEQNAKKALQCADRGYVFEIGRVIMEGTSDELQGNSIVQKAYLGLSS